MKSPQSPYSFLTGRLFVVVFFCLFHRRLRLHRLGRSVLYMQVVEALFFILFASRWLLSLVKNKSQKIKKKGKESQPYELVTLDLGSCRSLLPASLSEIPANIGRGAQLRPYHH